MNGFSDFIVQLLIPASKIAQQNFGKVTGIVKQGDNNQLITLTLWLEQSKTLRFAPLRLPCIVSFNILFKRDGSSYKAIRALFIEPLHARKGSQVDKGRGDSRKHCLLLIFP